MQIFFSLLCLVKYSFGANILFVSFVPSPSHHIWNEVMVKGLLGNGHNITKLGFFPTKIRNVNYTVLHMDANSLMESMDDFVDDVCQESTILRVISIWQYLGYMCNFTYHSEAFKTIRNYPKNFFELIIFDVTISHCYFPLIDYFGNPPVVGITTFGMPPTINEITGVRTESYDPFYALPYTNRMSFFQRFNNIIYQKLERLCKWYFMREIWKVSKQVFGRDTPYLLEYEKRISLIFSNDHPLLNYPKSFPPNVIPVGGIHVRKPKKLDEDIQKIMDRAENGVIFVSMGSNFAAKYYSENARHAFAEAFSRLNLTVLWKFENMDVSENVVLGKWFSQTDILAHPNTKLFITHCGALSSQETIIRGVPIVGVPLFMDQHFRATHFESIKAGIILKYSDLTADMVYDAIIEVLSNPECKENIAKLSNLYKTYPDKPLEKFLLWTEYVLKNGHLDHLSVAARYMKWYEVDNWDIVAFNVICIGIAFRFLRKCCCFAKKLFRKTSVCKQKIH